MEIKVFTKEACVQCDMTKKVMDRMGLEYEVVDTTEEQIDQLRDEGFRSFPVVKAEGMEWGGFRPDLLKELAVKALGVSNG